MTIFCDAEAYDVAMNSGFPWPIYGALQEIPGEFDSTRDDSGGGMAAADFF